jgi:TonB-dependent starch-binding outer membrane protein SusC
MEVGMQGQFGRRLVLRLAAAGLAVALSASAAVAQASAGVVRGRVVSEAGRPLNAAQVWIPGTNRIARTDDNGEYRLQGVPVGSATLRAQQIGFTAVNRSITVGADETVTADFTLREAALSLDAVVVTGTAAETRKKEVGNSTSMISAREIEVAPVKNTQDIISARAPGVTVLQNSGQPGAGGTIRLRGNNSLSQSNNPVVYVDGIRIYNETTPNVASARQNTLALNDIKADDIERIEVVKGAAATTLYGTEAAGGVIQIFTKRGTSSAAEWTVDVGGGFNRLGKIGPKSDPTGVFVNKCRGAELHNAFDVPFVDATCPERGTWLRDGAVQKYAMSVRGGVQQTTYFLSGSYNEEHGVVQNSEFKTGGLRGNFSFSPVKNLIFDFNSSYNRNDIDFIPDGNLANGFMLSVNRGSSGNFKGGQRGECVGITVVCAVNAYVFQQTPKSSADHFIGGLTMNYSPITAWTNRFAVGFDYNTNDNTTLIPFGFINLPGGSINKSDWTHTKLSLDYAGSYQRGLFGLATTSSWGGQYFADRDFFTPLTGTDFIAPGDPTLGSASRVTVGTALSRRKVVNAGLFLQEMVGWRDRLFVTGGLRVDGNSSFGSDFGLQPYPKVSVAYVISDESFWPTRFLPTLKLRAALGESGKAPGAFDAIRTWDPVAADDAKPAITPAQLGNPKLGPERTRETEFGFDMAALQDRVSLEATAYLAKTYDALVGVNYPPSEGWTAPQLENVGTIQNRGIELALSGTPLRTNRFEWSARVSYTASKSKTLDLGGREISMGSGVFVREGYDVPAFFGRKILNPDAIADPIFEDNAYLGPVYPTHLLGLSTSLRLGQRLNLDALGEYQGGSYLGNFIGFQNAQRFVWYPCYEVQKAVRAGAALNGVTALERARCYDPAVALPNSDYWIQKTNFFKLRSASISYRVPERFAFRMKSATLTLAGRNLWKSTKYDGLDPESRDAADAGNTLSRREYYQLPPSKQFLFSLRATF